MGIGKRAQSTAEYAVLIGLVIAVTGGILQVALKGGIRQKNQEALNYMLSSSAIPSGNSTVALYSQDFRETKISGGDDYVDEVVMEKGGLEKRYQQQVSNTISVSIETIDAAKVGG